MEQNTVRNGWLLNIPPYAGGILSQKVYNNGGGIDFSAESENGGMQIIRGTVQKEFDAYLAVLEAEGYKKIFENVQKGNTFVEYEKDGMLIYAYHLPAYLETRVIVDKVSVSVPNFCYSYEPKADETSSFYQYAMMFDPRGFGEGQCSNGKYGNCGMFYIVRLADNSLVLIDGGDRRQATDRSVAELLGFMREITHTPSTEKVRISAIYITHWHGDHTAMIEKLLENHADEIIIERAMYNIVEGCYAFKFLTDMGEGLKKNYPNIKFIKLHTGQSIQLANMRFDVLLTHEDIVNPTTAETEMTEQNSSSTVASLTLGGKKIMLLADIGGNHFQPPEYELIKDRLLGMFDIKCDAVQVSHHAINYWLDDIYNAIGAKFAFVPQQDIEYDMLIYPCYKKVVNSIRAAGAEKIYFSGRYTYCMELSAGKDVSITRTPILGADDGYADMLAEYKEFGNN